MLLIALHSDAENKKLALAAQEPTFDVDRHRQRGLMLLAHIETNAASTGIGLGAALAIVLSWQRNRSILWAIFHGICSWIYVIYFAATRHDDERK